MEANRWWDRYYSEYANKLQPSHENRIKDIPKMIPSNVESIIDIGCGSGLITNTLVNKYRVLGVDVSGEALQHVQTETKVGSITSIPIADNSYDLVLCSEVLEHIPYDVYEKALTELVRVSKKYILITVPNSENLDYHIVKCNNCFSTFHFSLHVRSFSRKDLPNLFSNCKLISYKLSGNQGFRPVFVVKLNRFLTGYNNIWRENLVCPQCKSIISRNASKSPLCFLLRALQRIIIKFSKFFGYKKAYNLIALYEKGDQRQVG